MATNSGYTKIFDDKNRGALLIIVGVLLIAFSMGNLEVGNSIKFIPSQDVSNVCLYAAIGIGVFLVLIGIILILHQKGILQSLLRNLLYFIVSIAIIAVAGIILGMRFFPREKPDVIQCYTVTPTSFQVYVSFWKIREYARSYQDKTLLVVYRKSDPALFFEEDSHIDMKQFTLGNKEMATLMVLFPSEFSQSLKPGVDMVEFALWLCPKDIQLADITTSLDIENQGGELLETASATVQTHRRWSGRHCPLFFQETTTNAMRSECAAPLTETSSFSECALARI